VRSASKANHEEHEDHCPVVEVLENGFGFSGRIKTFMPSTIGRGFPALHGSLFPRP
jgi:hypothetical protein